MQLTPFTAHAKFGKELIFESTSLYVGPEYLYVRDYASEQVLN